MRSIPLTTSRAFIVSGGARALAIWISGNDVVASDYALPLIKSSSITAALEADDLFVGLVSLANKAEIFHVKTSCGQLFHGCPPLYHGSRRWRRRCQCLPF